MDPQLLLAVVGILGTLGGAVIGAYLGHFFTSRESKRSMSEFARQKQIILLLAPVQQFVALAIAAAELWSHPHGKDDHIHSPQRCNEIKANIAILIHEMSTCHNTARALGFFDLATHGKPSADALFALVNASYTVGKIHQDGKVADAASVSNLLHAASHMQMEIARIQDATTVS